MSNKSYFHFKSFGLSKFADLSLLKVRNDIYDKFIESFKIKETDSILDVGVSAEDHPASNYFEKKYPYLNNLTALSIDDHKDLEAVYPGLKFVQGDGRSLPFPDLSFDYIYSHAVIEHVGSRENQRNFLKEMIRVAKRGFFITTPNRFHPLEFHTGLPFIQYLPKNIHRRIYKMLGFEFYSREENLNLLSINDLDELVRDLLLNSDITYKIESIKWMGFPSNLLLIVEREYP